MSERLFYRGNWNYAVRKDFVLCTALSSEARMLYVALRSFCAPDKDVAFPGMKELAAIMGKNRQTVEKYSRELVAAGCLEISENRVDGRFKGNIYTLIERPAQEIKRSVESARTADEKTVNGGAQKNRRTGDEGTTAKATKSEQNEPTGDEKTTTPTGDEKTVNGEPPVTVTVAVARATATDTVTEEATVTSLQPAPPAAVVPTAHSRFISLWFAAYRERFSVGYKFAAGQDGKAVKTLLASGNTPEELIAIAKRAWAAQGKFWCKQAGSICGFSARFNDIVAELTPPGTTGGKGW